MLGGVRIDIPAVGIGDDNAVDGDILCVIEINRDARIRAGLIPRIVVAAVDDAAPADADVLGVIDGDDGMQHRAAGDVERLPVFQHDSVHDPLAGGDIVDIRVVGIRDVGFQRIGEDVQRLVDVIVEDNGVLPRLRNHEGNFAVLDFGRNPPRLRNDGGAHHFVRQTGHFNLDAHVIDEQVVAVRGNFRRRGGRHRLRAFVEGQQRRILFGSRGHHPRGQQKHQRKHQDGGGSLHRSCPPCSPRRFQCVEIVRIWLSAKPMP